MNHRKEIAFILWCGAVTTDLERLSKVMH